MSERCRRCRRRFISGSDGQAPDPYWQTNHADEALGYSGTATVVANNYAMGNTATLPNFSFEVQGLLSLSGTNGLDANPAAIVSDFLTNPRYGAGFPVANLGDLSLYSTYCQALGIVLSPMLDTQQEAQQHLSRYREDHQQRHCLVGRAVEDHPLRRSARHWQRHHLHAEYDPDLQPRRG